MRKQELKNKQKIETEEEKKNRETVETIAESISSLARSVVALLKGPLNRKALIVLLANSARMNQTDVANVLTAIENLEKDWLNKK